MSVLENPMFLGKHGDRTIFNIENAISVNIAKYSALEEVEDEYLMLPGTKMKIKDILDAGNGLKIMQCEYEENMCKLEAHKKIIYEEQKENELQLDNNKKN